FPRRAKSPRERWTEACGAIHLERDRQANDRRLPISARGVGVMDSELARADRATRVRISENEPGRAAHDAPPQGLAAGDPPPQGLAPGTAVDGAVSRLVLFASLAAGAALRLWLAFSDDGVHWPDEIYQTLEPAHRAAFGYGLLAWEFLEGARSWALPALIAA